jgi:hypothetical protein
VVIITYSGPRAGVGNEFYDEVFDVFDSAKDMENHSLYRFEENLVLRFGSRLSRVEKIAWFSPDLQLAPVAAKLISEDKWRIDLPDGHLEITPIERGFKVSRK